MVHPTSRQVDSVITQLKDGTLDHGKAMSQDMTNAVVMKLLVQLLDESKVNKLLLDKFDKLEKKLTKQEEVIKTQQGVIADLKVDFEKSHDDFEKRLFKQEQYSSRNTVIITGLIVDNNLTVSELVCNTLNEASPGSNLTPHDLGHCHLNKVRKEQDTPRPPTITAVFKEPKKKDKLMQREVCDSLKAKDIRLLHHMGPTVARVFNELKAREDTKWAYYLGHSGSFSVKMVNDNYYKNVINYKDLDYKIEHKLYEKPRNK